MWALMSARRSWTRTTCGEVPSQESTKSCTITSTRRAGATHARITQDSLEGIARFMSVIRNPNDQAQWLNSWLADKQKAQIYSDCLLGRFSWIISTQLEFNPEIYLPTLKNASILYLDLNCRENCLRRASLFRYKSKKIPTWFIIWYRSQRKVPASQWK